MVVVAPHELALFVVVFVGASAVQQSINQLKKLANLPKRGLQFVIGRAIILPITAFFASVAGAVVAIFNIPIKTGSALASGVAGLIDALLGGLASLIGISASTSAQGLRIFGPLALPVGALILVAVAYIISAYRSEEQTSNFFPFVGGDVPEWVPLVGAEEEG